MNSSGSWLDGIPADHRHRFVSATQVRKENKVPQALENKNHSLMLQRAIAVEVSARMARLGRLAGVQDTISMLHGQDRPGAPMIKVLENIFAAQGVLVEMDNRLAEKEFTPIPRDKQLAMGATVDTSLGGQMFEGGQDFLNAFDEGLTLWRGASCGGTGFGTFGYLDVGGGAATRARKELPNYPDYAKRYGVTPELNRNLYPVLDSETLTSGTSRTFKGLLIETLQRFASYLGVRIPIPIMTVSTSAHQYVKHVTTDPEAAGWQADVAFWNQLEVQRYNINQGTDSPLPEWFPAGHGDSPRLAYEYGILEAMQSVGVEYLATGNGDEFAWIFLLPALIAKSVAQDIDLFAIAVKNTNGQFGGYFGKVTDPTIHGKDMQIETPDLPYVYVAKQLPPDTLNTTFMGGRLGPLTNGFTRLPAERKLSIVYKPTFLDIDGHKIFINMAGLDSWMGTELTRALAAGGGNLQVLEGGRNIFLGFKGPQQSADTAPQKFLFGKSYSDFYLIMARHVPEMREILLSSQGEAARLQLADSLVKHNFDLLAVALERESK